MRLLRRVRDFALVAGQGGVDAGLADRALTRLEVDQIGLDALDRRFLACIARNYGGGPVGVDTLAAALSEQRDTLEEVVEPYLLQQGLLQRTPRGRLLTRLAWQHLGLQPPPAQDAQAGLFDDPDPADD
jgi:Holliday junction DNA helicase RuvB